MHALLANPRTPFVATALVCAALLAFGYYLQYADGIEPCPMCIFQRLCYIAILVVASVAALHGPGRGASRVYGGLVIAVAALGGAIAARQVWLQHLPEDQVPACGPGLNYMLEMYPLGEVVQKALRGTGECASVEWRFLGGSIAEWSLLCFAVLALAHAAWLIYRRRNRADAARGIEGGS